MQLTLFWASDLIDGILLPRKVLNLKSAYEKVTNVIVLLAPFMLI